MENVISLKQHSVVRAGKTLEVFEAIKTRRSIRAFTNEEVSEEEVQKLIDAARHAPSAGNIQPWKFVIVRNPQRKHGLAAAALNETFIEEAPVVIVVCANEAQSGLGYGARGATLYCLQDTAAATQNMLLAACALGLGTCWVGAFYEEDVRKVVKVPKGVRPVAIVPVGHPAEKPSPKLRRSITEIMHYETF